MQTDINNITLLLWIAVIILWVVRSFGNKATLRKLPKQMKIQYVASIAAVVIVYIAAVHNNILNKHFLPQSVPVSLFGFILTALGLGLAVWARFFLGSNWSANPTVKMDHNLIIEGPYRFVRHPIYAGFLLAILGTAFEQTQTRSLLLFIFLFISFVVKARIEEKLMIETFGSQYKEYMRNVKGIVPYLWW